MNALLSAHSSIGSLVIFYVVIVSSFSSRSTFAVKIVIFCIIFVILLCHFCHLIMSLNVCSHIHQTVMLNWWVLMQSPTDTSNTA